MTTNPLDAIQARTDAATEGPWVCEPLGGLIYPSTPWSVFLHEANDDGDYPSVTDDGGDLVLTKANAVFIAHARQDVPKLVAALRAVEAITKREQAEHRASVAKWGRDCCSVVGEAWVSEQIDTAIREALG